MKSQLTYHKWFSIEVTHDYFKKMAYDNFSIVPSPSTIKAQRNYDIKINKQGNLLTFYVGSNEAGDFSMSEALIGLEVLTFELQMLDYLFKNYTNIPWSNEPYVILFTPNEQNRFTINADVSQDDCIARKPNFFSYKIPSQCQRLAVVNAQGEIVISYEFGETVPSQIFINVTQQEEGVFSILVNGQLHEKFYVSSNSAQYVVGVLQIPIKTMLAQLDPINEQGSYTIEFTARKSYWQYQVVVNPNRKLESSKISIEGTQKEIYDSPISKTLPGGNTATVFTSSFPLKLVDKLEKPPLLTIKYKFNYSNQAHELEIKLPTPEILSMRKYKDGEDGMSFLSTKIINV